MRLKSSSSMDHSTTLFTYYHLIHHSTCDHYQTHEIGNTFTLLTLPNSLFITVLRTSLEVHFVMFFICNMGRYLLQHYNFSNTFNTRTNAKPAEKRRFHDCPVVNKISLKESHILRSFPTLGCEIIDINNYTVVFRE